VQNGRLGGEGIEGDPKGWFTLPPMSKILKNTDCRTNLMGGVAIETLAPGGKHPCAATGRNTLLLYQDCD